MNNQIIREAPAPVPLHAGLHDPSHPAVPYEPVLDIDEIQGNILGGFNKDHQTMLFLSITDVAEFRYWLHDLVPFIATSTEVIAFNRVFKAVRSRRKRDGAVKSTWINIAFTHSCFEVLAEGAEDLANLLEKDFTDEAFVNGLANNSASLGDPLDGDAEGHPDNWVVGGTNGDPLHAVVIIASDDQGDLDDEVARFATGGDLEVKGADVIYEQPGENPPADPDPNKTLLGHEHFGFLDGVSQPGLRGRLSDNPHDVLTPRQNPNNRDQGKPGQDLLWPGEFVFGYPGQDAEADSIVVPGSLTVAGPRWARNGSFLVFRRLRQDVFGFHSFLKAQAATLGVTPALFGAKLVGRWRSGAPVLRTPAQENVDLAKDDCANNNFEFGDGTDPLPPTGFPNPFDCIDDFYPPSEGDKNGLICPFAGHIRKAYPRDDEARPLSVGVCSNEPEEGEEECGGIGVEPEDEEKAPKVPNEEDTQTHRLLRRGIPFGEASKSSFDNPIKDDPEYGRGLLFLAYQTSIVEQFEFVTKCWVNNPDFKDPNSGYDFIIGQNNNAPDRKRTMKYKIGEAPEDCKDIETTADWVIPTGGGYFFSPSIRALKMLAGRPPRKSSNS
jgi:deferrochelatase/peroxidase EfeB